MHVWRDFWLAYGVIAGKNGGSRVRSDHTCLVIYDTEPNHHYTAGCGLSNSHSGPVNFDIHYTRLCIPIDRNRQDTQM